MKAQITGDFYISSGDTLTTLINNFDAATFAGDGNLYIKTPGEVVDYDASCSFGANTVLANNMQLQDESVSGITLNMTGGLVLGNSSEFINTGTSRSFTGGKTYAQIQTFEGGRHFLFSPTVSSNDTSDFTHEPNLTSLHLWSEGTVAWIEPSEQSGYVEEFDDGPGGKVYTSIPFPVDMDLEGRGYSFLLSAETQMRFNSTTGFSDGNIEVDITNRCPSDEFYRNWHLLANPYPSAISTSSFLANNPNLSGISIYTDIDTASAGFNGGYISANSLGVVVGAWDGTTIYGNNPLTGVTDAPIPWYSSAESVAPGQGFFVHQCKATGEIDTARFTNSMRNTDNVNHLKQAFDYPLFYVDVVGQKEMEWGQIAFGIDDDLKPEQFNMRLIGDDYSTDGDFHSDRAVNLFAFDEEETPLSVKLLNSGHINRLIPVNLEIKEKGSFEFVLSRKTESEYEVILIDRVLKKEHSLSQKGAYRVSISKRLQTDRFYLKFVHSEYLQEDESFTMVSSNDEIWLYSDNQNTIIKEYSILDMQGRLIRRELVDLSGNIEISRPNVAKGQYLLVIRTEKGVYPEKIMLK
jgi:hypothetical protein